MQLHVFLKVLILKISEKNQLLLKEKIYVFQSLVFQEKKPSSDAETVAKIRKHSNVIWSFESPENE